MLFELNMIYKDYSKEFILESLKMNSFNLEKTINFLNDPKLNKGKY